MPATTTTTSSTIWCRRVTVALRLAPRRGAVDAEPGARERLQAGRLDGLAAALADAVRACLDLLQSRLDVAQRVPQLVGQHLGLAALGRHLAGIGEVGVVLQASGVTEAQLGELSTQVVPLLLEEGARVNGGGFVGHGHQRTSSCEALERVRGLPPQ